MSNALMALSGPAELSELQQAILAEVEAEQNAYDYIPTRIKFPSGGMAAFSTNDGDVIKPPFKAIIAVAQKARAWWPDKDTNGLPPLCSSPDGVGGLFDINAEEQIKTALRYGIRHPALDMMHGAAGPHNCATCPLGQWGSGANRGQACKSLRRLVLVVEGWSMPAIITLPPSSVKIFDAYASGRARERGQTYFTCWTQFGLEMAVNSQGIKYGVLKPTVAGALTEAETMAVIQIRKQYAELVRSLGINAEDYDTTPVNGNGTVVVDGRTVDAETGEIIDVAPENEPPF